MNRSELEMYILENYAAQSDYPWLSHPGFEVFRHCGTKKWFALIMGIKGSLLGLPSDEIIDIVNLKCDPILIGSLLQSPGFFPAYHMNKENWVSVALGDSVPDEHLKLLVGMSFDATAPKRRKTY